MTAASTVAPSGVLPSQLSAPTLAGGSVKEPGADDQKTGQQQTGQQADQKTVGQDDASKSDQKGAKPEWAKDIPDKYVRGTLEESLAAFKQGHGELEKTLSQRPGAQPKNAQTAEELVISQDDQQDDSITGGITAVLKTAGLKAEDVTEQWKKHGQLTPEQYQAFGRAKVGKEMINDFLSGQSARAELESMKVTRAVAEAEQAVGGKEALNTLRKWAADGGIARARLESLNTKLRADPTFYPDYMRLINQAHTEAVRADKAEPLITGQNNANSATTGTPTNKQEMAKLMYRVNNGDAEALAILNKMPYADVERLGA